ncbi:hypothetical protein OKA04_00740 [Luteolibacter flavescens]|uniref:DUF615 domain-containing protein n=1 Tax=Luteolibacter flavescens TaxID=1859460 RepID=A0ABT3FI84_9BACT|nr:hypothetical protein [Luteolibacter flavescens]MCW1883235.1 hypothetical protein [Luteolibacter flavescens]
MKVISPSSTVELPRPSIQRADDLMELGMHREALDMLDALPDELRWAAAARRVRARAAASLGKWQVALEEAKILRNGNESDRAEAARAFQAVAAEACKRGRDDDARRLVLMAVQCRQEQMDEILNDQRFPEKFLAKLAPKHWEKKPDRWS